MCKFFKSFEESSHLGVCKLAKYVRNCMFSGKICTGDKNFTRPPVAAVATNFKSGYQGSSFDILTGNSWSTTSKNAPEKKARQLRLLKSVLQQLASKSKMKWKDLQSQYHLPWSHTCFIIDRNSWATRIIDNCSRNKKNIGRTKVRKWCTILIMQKIQNSDQNHWQLVQK